ncbi:hypothetical protein HZF24_11900 [Sedimentibacter hydroxybenzoicus DSM 7310]|uniref:Uncharacterized protein n=1 Tax=Sedimentibacter hydroxybenzoicus DSM 7310 TaxID=1123245 RepID=A0A974GX25_SEDHY|nr:hypothetical protein [Sedimentibacter hydroxybenzoicus]NYB74841.1 hypothetical protein [Sedimentibacter hydroxybenzoicus DSM 7310]
MSYNLINQELGIYSCSTKDLGSEEVETFNKQVDGKLDNLTMFYNENEDKIILNADNDGFDLFKETIVAYLSMSQEGKAVFNKTRPSACNRLIYILDYVIQRRKLNEVKQLTESIPEFKGIYPVIVTMMDYEKQSQVIDIILGIDTSPLDINTLYGWNQHVKRGNIKNLILKGILPTDDNLKKYQDEINKEVEELNKSIISQTVPVILRDTDKNIKDLSEV